jgi:hypothetical protein
VIPNGDEPDSTNTEAEANSGEESTSNATQITSPNNTSQTAVHTSELSKPIVPSSHIRWSDVEDECFVDDEPSPSVTLAVEEGLDFTLALIKLLCHSSGPSQDHNEIDKIARSTLEQSVVPHPLPRPLDKDSGGWSDDNVAELEKELLRALELQDVGD